MHIKNILLICVCFVFFQPVFLSAQQIKKAPTQYSFDFGYRNLFSHSDNINLNNSHGYGVLFDYAWQLSGFDGTKNASYISVPIGYTILPGNDVLSKSVNMLNYGWTVRHYNPYPQFDQEKRFKLHYADLRIGIRF